MRCAFFGRSAGAGRSSRYGQGGRRRPIIPFQPPTPGHAGGMVLKQRTAGARELIEPNAENRYAVTRADLPLSCPMPGMSLWNSHPKVYLPVEDKGTAKCPYCGADYVLEQA